MSTANVKPIIYSFRSSQNIELFGTEYSASTYHPIASVRGTRVELFAELKGKMGTIRPWVEFDCLDGRRIRGVDISDNELEELLIDTIQFYADPITLNVIMYVNRATS